MKKWKDIEAEAFAWALTESGSKAKTKNGKEKAVSRWLENNKGTQQLKELYLDYLQGYAKKEMVSDFKHRKEVAKERKQIKAYPTWTRYHLAKTQEVKKTYQSKAGTMLIDSWIERIIKDTAYHDVFDSTRYRKTYAGKNSVEHIGHREEDNNKYGWDRVVRHYADYTAIEKNGRIAYRYSGSKEFEIFYHYKNYLKIRGRVYKKLAEIKAETVLAPHNLRRFYNLAIPENSPIKWVWDVEEKAGYYLYGTEKYHTVTTPKKSSRRYLQIAVRAFKKRKKEKLNTARAQRVFKNLNRVYVRAEDSIASGNCETETNNMRDKLAKELHAEGGFSIRADYLWKKRNDNYVRRAILRASEHAHI